ncbi:MAG TPA: AbrB/MazE/SpoVT family DNA-binding domain-containing protein [Pyrinomonadaceae bacterium]|nr:AbrB/MazE/SpoVT family DNA-binding domain-containing protein [Pyrinomonadaceae bacterium]
MRAKIIRTGNSYGIRLPKAIYDELQPATEVELEPTEDGYLIRKKKLPRAGWEAIFAKNLTENEDDHALTQQPTTFDRGEWRW